MSNDSYLKVAHEAADAARAILRERFLQPQNMILKADQSPVTEADKACEKAITDIIKKHFPTHGIFGEEFGRSNESAEFQWVIDPIDGTRAFLAGYPTFTTLIALCRASVPILGIIDNPILGERFVGVEGRKTIRIKSPLSLWERVRVRASIYVRAKSYYKSPHPSLLPEGEGVVSTSAIRELSQAIIGTTSAPYHFNEKESAAFERIRSQCMNSVIGGDGYGYAMLASGRLDIFMDAGLKPYDFCALAPVIQGAGGVITDWNGNPLTIESDGKVIAAGNAELHSKILQIMQT